jgi:hypothetical protein
MGKLWVGATNHYRQRPDSAAGPVSGATMPILSCSAARPKQVSIATTAAKTILQPIIGFNGLIYRWGIKKLESTNCCIMHAASQGECLTGFPVRIALLGRLSHC